MKNILIKERVMLKSAMLSIVAVVLLATTAYSQDKAVAYVKSQKLKVCSHMTFGQLIASNVDRATWDSASNDNGDIYVDITGTIGPAGERMSFYSRSKINMKNGGFTTTTMKLDGTPLSHDQILEIYRAMCR